MIRPNPSDPLASPVISVVIVNYNAWEDVVALVEALERSPEVRSGACEVVVVDNASAGPIPPLLRNLSRGVRLIARRDNGGFAVGVNAGWRASRGRWILLLNPDVVISDGWLGRMLERAHRYEADPEGLPGIVGFALRNPDGSAQPSVGAFPGLARAVWEQLLPRSRRKYQAVWRTKAGPVDWVTGACMLVSGRLLDVLGGLDEDFFLYYEEVALCRSASRLGWRVEYDPDPSVSVIHLRPLQNRAVSPKLRVITRHSKLLYFRKHLPRWQFRALAAVVALEARARGARARWLGRRQDARAWRTVAGIERELRLGRDLGGSAVRDLAEEAVSDEPARPLGPGPTRPVSSRGLRR